MGKFDAYKIDLKGMQADSTEYEFLLDNLYFAHIDNPEIQKGNVRAVLRVKKTSVAYDLYFHLEGVVVIPCDRCLEEMDQDISLDEKVTVKLGHDYSEEDDVVIIPEEEGIINVSWMMFEMIALAVPMKHVHAPGKCNNFMLSKLSKHMSRNVDDEDDEDPFIDEFEGDEENNGEIDPRWSELKKIIDNN